MTLKWKNIVLVGFMGTGKSAVSRALAEKLKWKLVDTDQLIEKREGKSIPSIFKDEGEAYFRKIESSIIQEVMAQSGQVVSTGGGAVLAEENRTAMKQNGLVVALTASAETIIQRVGSDKNRPLLQGKPEEIVPQMMEKRKFAYDFADVKIDTDQQTIDQITSQIINLENE